MKAENTGVLYVIREARVQDAAAIANLSCKCLGYEYDEEKTARKLRILLEGGRDRIFVAVFSGKVAGYIHANDYDTLYFDHMKNVMGIAVSDEYRRYGVGRALLEAVEEWARESGACGVRLVSGASRSGAHSFYRACGYGSGRQQLNFKKMF